MSALRGRQILFVIFIPNNTQLFYPFSTLQGTFKVVFGSQNDTVRPMWTLSSILLCFPSIFGQFDGTALSVTAPPCHLSQRERSGLNPLPPVGRDDPGGPFHPVQRFGGPRSSRPTKVSKPSFASHILASPKCNPPPQFANWGTSFQKEAFRTPVRPRFPYNETAPANRCGLRGCHLLT